MVELCEEYSRGVDTLEKEVHRHRRERGGKWFSRRGGVKPLSVLY